MMCIVIYNSAFLGYFNILYTYFDSEIPSAFISEHPFFKIFLKDMLPDTHSISMLHMLIACALHVAHTIVHYKKGLCIHIHYIATQIFSDGLTI